jgi:hypothetical protein
MRKALVGLMQEPCQARIRIRAVPEGSTTKLCPFDCNTRGTCHSLPDLFGLFEADAASGVAAPPQSAWVGVDDHLTCMCDSANKGPQFTGRFCEANLTNFNAQSGPLKPGKWRAHQYDVGEGEPAKLSVELTVLAFPSSHQHLMNYVVLVKSTLYS